MKPPNIQNVLMLMKKNLFYYMILVSFISCETSEKNSNEKENNKSSVEQNESEKNSKDEEILRNYKRGKELEKQEFEDKLCLSRLKNNLDYHLGTRYTPYPNSPSFREKVSDFGLSKDFEEFMIIYNDSRISCKEKTEKWETFFSNYQNKLNEWMRSIRPSTDNPDKNLTEKKPIKEVKPKIKW
jgi:hypothetical protein